MTATPQRSTASRPFQWSRLTSPAQDGLLIAITAIFVTVHVRHIADGELASIPFALENVILATLFLTRRKSRSTSGRPLDWTVAAIGGWGTFALQLHDGGPAWLDATGFAIQLSGLCFASFCFLNLGRSFGIVAANRGLKTNGPYGFVRHPIYACHFITNTGFLMVNPHPINFAILAVVLIAQVMRMNAEERVLTESGDYANYASEVRYRLIPGVY